MDFYPDVWRNIGILWALYVVYTIFVILSSMLLVRDTGLSSSKVYKRGARAIDPREDLDKERNEAE